MNTSGLDARGPARRGDPRRDPVPTACAPVSRGRLWIAAVCCGLGLCAVRAADQPTFSHQLHLSRGAQCVDCHAAAAASNSATDANLPSFTQCASCHDGTKASRLAVETAARQTTEARSYRFDHAFHLQFGNVAPILAGAIDSGSYLGAAGDARRHLDSANACEACHRGLRETDLAAKHNLPRMSDCLVCHSEIDNPFTCDKCHLEGVDLRPDNHTRDFVDLHATGTLNLDKQTCLPCHGRNFACMGCH